MKKNERLLRSLVAIRYKGSAYTCNLCNAQLSRFIFIEERGKLCPKCGSLPRTRRLWDLLQNEVALNDKSVLHFSPPLSLKERLRKCEIKSYSTTDYEGEFNADYDITAIDKEDACLDIIICYHVLEHIEDDEAAIKELYRVLTKNGKCFIQTPFKEGAIYEDFSFKTKKERLHYFGQEDHVRIYSITSLKSRLEKAGFRVEVCNFTSDENNVFGFQTVEDVLIAIKK
jgi:predicted SAM-dependent methyltransferase